MSRLDQAKLFYIDPGIKAKDDIANHLRGAGFEVAGFLHDKVNICITDETSGRTTRPAVVTPRISSRRHRQLLTLQQAPEEKNTWLLANQLGIAIFNSSQLSHWLDKQAVLDQPQVVLVWLSYLCSSLIYVASF
jgi:hypothetical protein